MQIITQALKDPTDWFVVFDETLFVRLYVHYEDEAPEKAVRQTLKTISTNMVYHTIPDNLVKELCNRMMSNPRVTDAINQHMHMRIYKAREMGTQWVIEATKDVYERCMQMVPVKTSDGTPIFAKFNPAAALKAVELAGKHVDVQAFKEVIEHETGPNLTAVLDAARKRLEEGTKAIVIDQEDDVTDIPQVSQNQLTLDELLGTSNA